MTNNVIPMFAFGDQQLRCVSIDGEPWFAATDVCRILGLLNSSKAVKPLEADERGYLGRPGSLLWKNTDPRFAGADWNRLHNLFLGTPFSSQLTLISRPGLFKLISRSSKPAAREFDRWVRHEVLPQIMDNGGYVAPDADVKKVAEAAPTNTKRTDLDLMKTVMSAMNAMQERIGELEAEAVQSAPKVDAYNTFLDLDGSRREIRSMSPAIGCQTGSSNSAT